MPRRWRAGLAVLLATATTAAAAPAVPPDPGIATAEHLIAEGDLQGALEALDPALRRLSADRTRGAELALAHLYMGVAYAGLDQEKAARASFREALQLDRRVALKPEVSSRKALRLLEDARRELGGATPEAAPRATPTPAPPAWVERAGRLPRLGAERAQQIVEQARRIVVTVVARGPAGGTVVCSGFVLDEIGRVAAPASVLAGAQSIEYRFANGKRLEAEVLGQDTLTDLAVLNPRFDTLEAAQNAITDNPAARDVAAGPPYGDSAAVGDPVVAVGLGDQGSIVAIGVLLASVAPLPPGAFEKGDVRMIDTAPPRGIAGAPWFDAGGRIIGIASNVSATPGAAPLAVSFALPINRAKNALSQLVAKGRVERGWAGVSLQALAPEQAQAYGVGEGVVVAGAMAGGPAAAAGLRVGDLIEAVEGRPVATPAGVVTLVSDRPPGARLAFRVHRPGAGSSLTLGVTLRERPPEGGIPDLFEQFFGNAPPPLSFLPGARGNLLIKGSGGRPVGILIAGVDAGSPASALGLLEGDVVVEVGGRAIRKQRDLDREAGLGAPPSGARVKVWRSGTYLTLAVGP